MVQCGSCGNKWRQFPINQEVKKDISDREVNIKKIPNNAKNKKKKLKKTRSVNLYSPEYLAKKHGISLNDEQVEKKTGLSKKTSFGFYDSLIIFFVTVITLSKGLHFFQDLIVQKLPFTKFYLDYFFESIKNIFEICKNLISNY